jgi:hypothetical protein
MEAQEEHEEGDGDLSIEDKSGEIEQTIESMFNTKEGKGIKIMKFKSEIDQLSIYVLVDSSSTLSFVHSSMLQANKYKIVQTLDTLLLVIEIDS